MVILFNECLDLVLWESCMSRGYPFQIIVLCWWHLCPKTMWNCLCTFMPFVFLVTCSCVQTCYVLACQCWPVFIGLCAQFVICRFCMLCEWLYLSLCHCVQFLCLCLYNRWCWRHYVFELFVHLCVCTYMCACLPSTSNSVLFWQSGRSWQDSLSTPFKMLWH